MTQQSTSWYVGEPCCPEFARNGYSHTEVCPAFEENDPGVRVARARDAAALAEAHAALDERRQERDDAHTEVGDLTAKLAAVQALAERWYWSDDGTYLDYCGRKVLEALGLPMPTQRGAA